MFYAENAKAAIDYNRAIKATEKRAPGTTAKLKPWATKWRDYFIGLLLTGIEQ